MREGLAHLEAGVSARRVLAEGKPPRNMALDWFRREMNLSTPVPGDVRGMSGGVSAMHALVMALLVAFALAMIALYFVKMRRAAALLASLGAGPGTPTPGTTPRSAAAPAAPEAPAPATTAAQPAPTPAPAPPRALWSGKLRVGNIQRETPSVKTFRLMLPSGDPIPFTFAPGQFVNVFVQIDGKRVTRSYSIASSPTQRGYVELGIKREEHGLLSRHMHDVVKVGDELDISGPVGRFTFTGTEDDSVVLIAGGVGITPMMSIVRYLSDRCWPGQIYLVFLCRAPEEFIFRDELEALQRQNPRLQVTVTMSRAERTDWKGPRGRVSKDLLLKAIPDLTKRRIHLCGPPPMMDAVKALLGELGVPPDHLHTEAFGPPSKTNPAVTVVTPPAVAAEGPLVSFSTSGKSARIRDGKTVLDLADEIGVSIDSSCRAGTCGVCKVKLASGEVTMAVEDALDASEKASGVILACQARPRGDIAVEA
ncbi:FAD-binding oxidoreductase [Sorangium sp. So ce1182]|uniref:FAD-binding oxidoreductase n=1 Tax=Sorangium sp. So ce1182 TaxID=3133334 RepID=UPI003F6479A5